MPEDINHCQEKDCGFYPEGDDCYYWKNRKDGKCRAMGDYLKITEPLWNKEFNHEQ